MDLARYYRSLLKKEYYLNNLNAPKNEAHVTLASSKEAVFKETVKDINKRRIRVNIDYINDVNSDSLSFWLIVTNQDELWMLTESFVKQRIKKKRYRFHLTIANFKNTFKR